MKQHITQKQWNELSEKQIVQIKMFLINYPELDKYETEKGVFLLTIGQMIEFLGDDVSGIINHYKFWNVLDVNRNSPVKGHRKELVDALWEAVKQKLK